MLFIYASIYHYVLLVQIAQICFTLMKLYSHANKYFYGVQYNGSHTEGDNWCDGYYLRGLTCQFILSLSLYMNLLCDCSYIQYKLQCVYVIK